MSVAFLLSEVTATRLTSGSVAMQRPRDHGYDLTRHSTKDVETAFASRTPLLYGHGARDAYGGDSGIPSFNPSTVRAARPNLAFHRGSWDVVFRMAPYLSDSEPAYCH